MTSLALQGSMTQRSSRLTGMALLAGYAVLYALTLFAMIRFGHFEAGEALGVLAVLGVGFSLLAWLLTLGVKPLAYNVHEPSTELAYLLLYLLPLAAVVAYGFDAVHRLVATQPAASSFLLGWPSRSWSFRPCSAEGFATWLQPAFPPKSSCLGCPLFLSGLCSRWAWSKNSSSAPCCNRGSPPLLAPNSVGLCSWLCYLASFTPPDSTFALTLLKRACLLIHHCGWQSATPS